MAFLAQQQAAAPGFSRNVRNNVSSHLSVFLAVGLSSEEAEGGLVKVEEGEGEENDCDEEDEDDHSHHHQHHWARSAAATKYAEQEVEARTPSLWTEEESQ